MAGLGGNPGVVRGSGGWVPVCQGEAVLRPAPPQRPVQVASPRSHRVGVGLTLEYSNWQETRSWAFYKGREYLRIREMLLF